MQEYGENVPSSLLAVKAYDIRLHILATKECQELASKFEERARQSLYRDDGCVWSINLWCSKIYSMAWDQFQRWTSNLFCFLPRARRQILNDQGRGSGKRSDIQRWHSRIFGLAVDWIFSLHIFCTQICGWHGEIHRMQSYSRCKARKHIQLSRVKDSNSAWGMEQIFSK